MPITYVRLVHSKPEPVVFRSPFEGPADSNVLLFDPIAEATSAPIGDLFRQLDGSLLANDIIIFRGAGTEFVRRLDTDHILPSVLSGKKAVGLISATSEKHPGPTWYPIKPAPLPDGIPAIETVREFELFSLFHRNRAVFESNEYHYALPSGWHADKFVRLGDALRNIDDVQRIADWLLPYAAKRTIVVGDTGSMLPLLLSLREQARNRLGWDVAIATLDEYPRDKLAILDALGAANKRPAVEAARLDGEDLRWLFVISVNSSGRLCEWLHQQLPEGGKIVVVCQTSKEKTPCEAALTHIDVTRWETDREGKCELCRNKRHVIHVHPESYELLPKIEYTPVTVNQKVAVVNAQFWTMANEADAVELHVTVPYPSKEPDGRRHFSVFLNTKKLAEHATFREHCKAELSRIEPPDLVMVPEHPNCQVVVDLCREVHPKAEYVAIPQGPLRSTLDSVIKGAKRILVADDAVVTGATFKYLRSDVYRVTQSLGIDPDVCAFAMVARTSNRADMDTIRRRYTNAAGKRFFTPFELYLPDGQSCPWCDEQRFLNRFRAQLKGYSLEQLNKRIDALERDFQPPLLMVNPPAERGDLKSLGSFFGLNLNAKVAFAAGSSAAQTIIQDLATLGGGIQFKVADLGMAYDAYYEGVILASLLRTFRAIHVRCPSHDPLVEQKIKDIVPDRAYPGVLTELALAALMGKVPSKPIRDALESWKDQDRWIPMMMDLFKLVEPM